MRKIVLGLAAAGLLLTAVPMLTAVPAAAQIGVEVGPGGVGVEVGRDRDYRRGRVYEERRVYSDGRRYGRDDCRTTVRRTLPNGNVVIRRINRC